MDNIEGWEEVKNCIWINKIDLVDGGGQSSKIKKIIKYIVLRREGYIFFY